MDEWGVTKSITPKINHLSDRSGEIHRVRLGGSGRQSLQQHSGGGQGGCPPTTAPGLRDGCGGVSPPDRISTRQIQAWEGAPDDQRSNTKGGYPPPRGPPVHGEPQNLHVNDFGTFEWALSSQNQSFVSLETPEYYKKPKSNPKLCLTCFHT